MSQLAKQLYKVDALIIGGGTTGLSAGIGLLKAGKKVVIIEKHMHGFQLFSRALLIDSLSISYLKKSGIDINIFFNNTGIKMTGFTLNNKSIEQTLFQINLNTSDEMNEVHPIVIGQLYTEKIMMEHYMKLGGHIMKGYEFQKQNVISGNDFFTGPFNVKFNGYQKENPNGMPIEVECQYIFGCDGKHSAVREWLGIKSRIYGPSFTGKGADYLIKGVWPFKTTLNVFVQTGGSYLIANIGKYSDGDHVRLMVLGNQDLMMQRAKQQMKGLIGDKPIWEGPFVSDFSVVEQLGKGNVWLAGDASHCHSPIGGRGMNLGISDGFTIALSLTQGDGLKGLNIYEAARHQYSQKWVQSNAKVAQFFMSNSYWANFKRFIICFVVFTILTSFSSIRNWLANKIQNNLYTNPMFVDQFQCKIKSIEIGTSIKNQKKK